MYDAAKKLKEKLKKREVSIGTWLMLGNSAIAEIVSDCAFDWITIDMEHSVTSLSQAQQMMQVISRANKVPLVRLPDHSATTIKRVMDAGAAGVIVPNVKTAEEAQAIVSAVKYPPVGTRGVGLARAQGYGLGFEEYKAWINNGSIIIVQIEHVLGVENLKKILEVPGIDGIFIGPYDLSASIGLPGKLNDPKVEALVQKAMKITLDMGFSAGYHVVAPDVNEVKARIKQGFNFVGYSLDTLMLGRTFRDHLKEIRSQIK
ncbi:MAG: 2,4-dihydroxyhept-2-ene-1,7-dioic acid aldolase [Thaumarchaeota archaeon]|nr:2,4-dihydroxyhept-2-ene-1,7-dioic acid aldolase [Nitrososphaerota archaeon]